MDILDIIKTRRSVRHYLDQKIPREIIDDLIEAGRWAPSAGNLQPLEIIIVQNEDAKLELVSAAGGQEFLAECHTVFVIIANIPRTRSKYRERGELLYCIQDTAAAIQNIMLLAHERGIASCWVGAFNENEVAKIVKLPDEVRPIGMISLGYKDPAYEVIVRERREPAEFVHKEVW